MQIVEKESWPRREVYEFFAGMSHPFYALTFPVDVTPLRAWCKERGLSFYAAMVYGVTKAMERVDAFLYKDRGEQIVKVDRLVPSFTDLHPGSEQFHIVTLEAGDNLADFCRRARAKSAAQTVFISESVGGPRTSWSIFPACRGSRSPQRPTSGTPTRPTPSPA